MFTVPSCSIELWNAIESIIYIQIYPPQIQVSLCTKHHKAISLLYLFESIVWLVTLPEVSVKRIDAFLKWMKLQTTRRWVRWLRRKFRWFAAVGKPTLLLWGRLLLLGSCWARAWRICAQASRRKLSEAFLAAVRQAGMMATSTTLWHCATSNCCTPQASQDANRVENLLCAMPFEVASRRTQHKRNMYLAEARIRKLEFEETKLFDEHALDGIRALLSGLLSAFDLRKEKIKCKQLEERFRSVVARQGSPSFLAEV